MFLESNDTGLALSISRGRASMTGGSKKSTKSTITPYMRRLGIRETPGEYINELNGLMEQLKSLEKGKKLKIKKSGFGFKSRIDIIMTKKMSIKDIIKSVKAKYNNLLKAFKKRFPVEHDWYIESLKPEVIPTLVMPIVVMEPIPGLPTGPITYDPIPGGVIIKPPGKPAEFIPPKITAVTPPYLEYRPPHIRPVVKPPIAPPVKPTTMPQIVRYYLDRLQEYKGNVQVQKLLLTEFKRVAPVIYSKYLNVIKKAVPPQAIPVTLILTPETDILFQPPVPVPEYLPPKPTTMIPPPLVHPPAPIPVTEKYSEFAISQIKLLNKYVNDRVTYNRLLDQFNRMAPKDYAIYMKAITPPAQPTIIPPQIVPYVSPIPIAPPYIPPPPIGYAQPTALPAIPAIIPAPQPLPYGPQYPTTYQAMSGRIPIPARPTYPVYPQQRGYEMVPSVREVIERRIETPVYEDITSKLLFGEPVTKVPPTYEEIYARPEPEPMYQEEYYEPDYYQEQYYEPEYFEPEMEYYEQAPFMTMPVTMEEAGRFSPYGSDPYRDEGYMYGLDEDISNKTLLLALGGLSVGMTLLSLVFKKKRRE